MENIKQILEQNRNNIDNLDFDVADVDLKGITTADKFQYYGNIKDKWEYGVNTVNGVGEIVSRNFTILRFPETEASIEEIDLGYYDEEYEGRFFYRVLTRFEEIQYTLLDIKEYREWEKSVNDYYMEQLFNNEAPIQEVKEIEVYDPANFVNTASSGRVLNNRGSGGDSNINSATPSLFALKERLKKENDGCYLLQEFNIGRALGVSFSANVPFSLYLNCKKDKEGEDVPPIEENITSSKKYSPALKNDKYLLCFDTQLPPKIIITVNLWGTIEKNKIYLLNGELEDQEETLLHPEDEELHIKLKPPGKAYFEDDFWNMRDPSQLPKVEDIFVRLSSNYGFKN